MLKLFKFSKNVLGTLYIPLAWTVFIQVLLCLPGDDLPSSEGLFDIPYFDKIVHTIFFGLFVSLWSYYFSRVTSDNNRRKKIFFIIFLVAAANGIIVEYVQLYFIPLRSFDPGDIIADILSSAIAYGICNVMLLSY